MSERATALGAIVWMYLGALLATVSLTAIGIRPAFSITGDPWIDAFVIAGGGTVVGIVGSIILAFAAVAFYRWRFGYLHELDVDAEELREWSP